MRHLHEGSGGEVGSFGGLRESEALGERSEGERGGGALEESLSYVQQVPHVYLCLHSEAGQMLR